MIAAFYFIRFIVDILQFCRYFYCCYCRGYVFFAYIHFIFVNFCAMITSFISFISFCYDAVYSVLNIRIQKLHATCPMMVKLESKNCFKFTIAYGIYTQERYSPSELVVLIWQSKVIYCNKLISWRFLPFRMSCFVLSWCPFDSNNCRLLIITC